MANPQDNKAKKAPSAIGSETGAAQPKSSAASSGPSSGHDQMNQGNFDSQGTGSSTGSPQSMAGQDTVIDQPMGEKISSTANGILDKAKETASGTYDAVATRATSKIEEHKVELSAGLRTLADSFRKTGTDLKTADQTTPLTDLTARYTGTAANQIEKMATYFERKNLRAMMRDAEDFARRNPAIFLGAAFALGMVAGRFLKSSAPDAGTSMNAESMKISMPTALPPAERQGNSVTRTT